MISHFSRVWLFATLWTVPHQAALPWDSPGKNTGVGWHVFLRCIKVKSESEVGKVKLLSRVRLSATPWTAAYQAPPSMGFSRQEHWSGVPLPSPTGLAGGFFTTSATWEAQSTYLLSKQSTLKPLTVWITTNYVKFWRRWEYETTWPASWETCMKVKKQWLEPDMEQQTGSKLGKE